MQSQGVSILRAIMVVSFLVGASPQPSATEYLRPSILRVSNTQYLFKKAKVKSIIFTHIISYFLFVHIYKKDRRKLATRKEVQLPPWFKKPSQAKWKRYLDKNWGPGQQSHQISCAWSHLGPSHLPRVQLQTHEACLSPRQPTELLAIIKCY